MRRQDYFQQGSRGWLRLHEKGGKRHDVPAHHRAAEALDAYLEAAGPEDGRAALFQSVDRVGDRLTGRSLTRRVVLATIKRRAATAGLPPSTCCHTFRATGITAYLSNGGTLEHAQQIAGHASPKTTKLYDRNGGHGDGRRDRVEEQPHFPGLEDRRLAPLHDMRRSPHRGGRIPRDHLPTRSQSNSRRMAVTCCLIVGARYTLGAPRRRRRRQPARQLAGRPCSSWSPSSGDPDDRTEWRSATLTAAAGKPLLSAISRGNYSLDKGIGSCESIACSAGTRCL